MAWTREQLREHLKKAREMRPNHGNPKTKKADPLNPKPRGRPRKVRTEEEVEKIETDQFMDELRSVEKLAELQVGDRDISIYIEMPLEYVQSSYRETIDRAQLLGRVKLLAAQFENALAGNSNMQMWLGKHCLGQKEGVDGTTIQPEFRTFMSGLKKIGEVLNESKRERVGQIDECSGTIVPKHTPTSKPRSA